MWYNDGRDLPAFFINSNLQWNIGKINLRSVQIAKVHLHFNRFLEVIH